MVELLLYPPRVSNHPPTLRLMGQTLFCQGDQRWPRRRPAVHRRSKVRSSVKGGLVFDRLPRLRYHDLKPLLEQTRYTTRRKACLCFCPTWSKLNLLIYFPPKKIIAGVSWARCSKQRAQNFFNSRAASPYLTLACLDLSPGTWPYCPNLGPLALRRYAPPPVLAAGL